MKELHHLFISPPTLSFSLSFSWSLPTSPSPSRFLTLTHSLSLILSPKHTHALFLIPPNFSFLISLAHYFFSPVHTSNTHLLAHTHTHTQTHTRSSPITLFLDGSKMPQNEIKNVQVVLPFNEVAPKHFRGPRKIVSDVGPSSSCDVTSSSSSASASASVSVSMSAPS